MAQRTQQEAARAAADLSVTLTEIRNRTNQEMVQFNTTASAVREGLETLKLGYKTMTVEYPWWINWANYGIPWLFQKILRSKLAWIICTARSK